MSEQEQALAEQEARTSAARSSAGAERARLWAGMNRYLAAEAAHAHRANDESGKSGESTSRRRASE